MKATFQVFGVYMTSLPPNPHSISLDKFVVHIDKIDIWEIIRQAISIIWLISVTTNASRMFVHMFNSNKAPCCSFHFHTDDIAEFTVTNNSIQLGLKNDQIFIAHYRMMILYYGNGIFV